MRAELTALRGAMARSGVDVYVIPTDDFHGSEYVGRYFRCRAYVSGFTGSAGTLVVSRDWAGLWTDGRYFLQGAQQLRGTGIDLMKMNEKDVPTIEGWLETHLAPGQVLGFDGRTMTSKTGDSYEAAAKKAGATVSWEKDLVGEIWKDRPPLSEAPAWELSLEYAGRSRKEKLEALKKDMAAQGADTYILTSLDDLCWLLNLRGDDVACCPVVLGDLMLDETGTWLYIDEKKLPPELKKSLEADGIVIKPYLNLYEDVKALPADARVLLDPAKVNYAILQGIPKSATILKQVNPTELPKAIKNETEQENIKKAHIRDGVALTRFMKWVKEHVGKEPVTEISAARKLEEFRGRMEHYLGPSFDPIMGYGPHGAIIHYSATEGTDAPLEAKGFLLSDTGGHYLEGSTDVTRTFVLGPLTKDMRQDYTTVLQSHLALAGAVFKESCGGAGLDVLARLPLWERGQDYNHGTGHGVGYLLGIHEGPQRIRYGCHADVPMAVGMITSNEPGIYLEGKYGIRLENLELCIKKAETEYGVFLAFEHLTLCPFELEAIDLARLTEQEKALLNAYHKQVFETLSPLMDREEADWLRNATRPI